MPRLDCLDGSQRALLEQALKQFATIDQLAKMCDVHGGSPGTPEGRRKGGQISSARFRANPALAKALGFKLRTVIKLPERSALLAEFIGIMLGDGCLSSRFQVGISYNAMTDRAYGTY